MFEWEPFKIRPDLALNIPIIELENKEISISPDEIYEIRDNDLFETDKINSTSRDHFNLQRFIFTFSQCKVGKSDRDITRLFSKDHGKWDTIKSFPSLFLHSPYQDTFGSIGRIFEPQVNLGIKF